MTALHDSELRVLLRLAPGTAALLAKHSAAAQSLVTHDEDAIDAAVTCCALLLREHDVGLDVAMNAINILAALSSGDQLSWRDLARIRECPLSPALAGSTCDEHLTQQLHTIAEVLQFPKPVSLLLQRQLAVFRLRRDAAAGGSATATLVRAEAVLAPLLEQAEGIVDTHFDPTMYCPSCLKMRQVPAFWRGFFGDPEDPVSLDTGRRELDHMAYGAGRIFAGRGLPSDLLQATTPSCANYVYALAFAAAAVGDVATIAALHHAGRSVPPADVVRAAAQAGQPEVIRLALDLGWKISVDECLLATAEAALNSDTRLQILSLFADLDPASLGEVLPAFARCGDVPCVQLLLRVCHFDPPQLNDAVVQAATGGHIPLMAILPSRYCRPRWCVLSAEVRRASAIERCCSAEPSSWPPCFASPWSSMSSPPCLFCRLLCCRRWRSCRGWRRCVRPLVCRHGTACQCCYARAVLHWRLLMRSTHPRQRFFADAANVFSAAWPFDVEGWRGLAPALCPASAPARVFASSGRRCSLRLCRDRHFT
jgi:hypothetical protein